jgi:hypothetical protein
MSNPRLDRRALLLAGTGTIATAALVSVEPAAAGTTTTKVFKGHFGPANDTDWHYLPFHVPAGVREIEVSYTHDPPRDTGAGFSQNVVDLGIFDSSGIGLGNAAGFRGWSGGSRDRFRISRSAATPGYLAGPITPGRWRIVLGPYQIVSRTDYAVTIKLHHGRPGPRFAPTPALTTIPGTGPGWYRGDLHVHTVHSDGSQTQKQVLDDAVAAGLDFIGSSEHNTSSAQLTWGKHLTAEHAGFLVMPGEEVTTRAGHWLAAGLPAGTWIDWRYRPETSNDNAELARFTQQVRTAGGLAIAAHPRIPVPSIRWDFDDDFAHMDAIEVWNGPWDGFDALALSAWHRLLLAGTFIPAVGNSDSHNSGQQIGLAQTVVRAEALSVDAIIAGYRGGHSWITGSSDVDLDFTATLGAVTGSCGDTVPSTAADTVAVRLEVTGVPDGAVATLIGRSGVLGTSTAVDGTIRLDTTVAGGAAFVRAEVKQGSVMVALTNPIFLAVRPSSAE